MKKICFYICSLLFVITLCCVPESFAQMKNVTMTFTYSGNFDSFEIECNGVNVYEFINNNSTEEAFALNVTSTTLTFVLIGISNNVQYRSSPYVKTIDPDIRLKSPEGFQMVNARIMIQRIDV